MKLMLKYFYPPAEVLVYLELTEDEIIKRKNEYSKEKREKFARCLNEVVQQFRPHILVSDNIEKNTFLVNELIQKTQFEKSWLKKISKQDKQAMYP